MVLPLSPSDVNRIFPIDDTLNMRPILAFAFGLPGFVLAVLALTGRRRAVPLAVTAVTFSGFALLFGLIMVANQTM